MRSPDLFSGDRLWGGVADMIETIQEAIDRACRHGWRTTCPGSHLLWHPATPWGIEFFWHRGRVIVERV
jgi:hypothetical protein